MNKVNLTANPITLIRKDGSKETIEPSGINLLLECKKKFAGASDGYPIIKNVCKNVRNLPESKPDTIYLVEKEMAMFIKERYDVFVPAGYNGEGYTCFEKI